MDGFYFTNEWIKGEMESKIRVLRTLAVMLNQRKYTHAQKHYLAEAILMVLDDMPELLKTNSEAESLLGEIPL